MPRASGVVLAPSGHCIGSVVPHRRNTPPVSFQSFHITALPAHGYTRRGFPPRCPQRRCIPLRTPFRPQVCKDGLQSTLVTLIIVEVSFALLASGIAGGLQLLEASPSPMHGTTSSSSGGMELRDVRRVLKKRRLPREPRFVEASKPASLASGPGNRIQQGPKARQSDRHPVP